MIYLIASVAAIAGFLFGFDEGVIAGILGVLKAHFHLSKTDIGILASALPLGALFASLILGSYISTKLTYYVGRRTAILAAAVLFVFSALAAALAPNYWLLVTARVVTGLAIGLAGVMTPLYIAEMMPARVRGRLVSAYQLAITIGIVFGYIVNYLFVYGVNWRWMFASGAIPGLVLFVGMWFLPESHRWLLLNNKHDKAAEVLDKIHTSKDVEHDIHEIEETIHHEENLVRWREILAPMVRPALLVAMMLFVLQQMSGINVVIYYAPSIFKDVGFSSNATQILASVGVGAVNMLSTVLAMWLIEKLGRRKLLYIGFAGTTITLAIIALGTYTQAQYLDWIAFIATMAYIFFFAVSLGPIPHIMMSEVFPIHLRNTGMGIASICNWGFNFLVVLTFPDLVRSIGLSTTFIIYAVACVIGLVFTYFYVPETKGVSLEAITEHLLHRKPLRTLGKG
ncbi:MAG: sugar porter family MFS transporter [Gammaproteobacteria bacterium]